MGIIDSYCLYECEPDTFQRGTKIIATLDQKENQIEFTPLRVVVTDMVRGKNPPGKIFEDHLIFSIYFFIFRSNSFSTYFSILNPFFSSVFSPCNWYLIPAYSCVFWTFCILGVLCYELSCYMFEKKDMTPVLGDVINLEMAASNTVRL
jgi:hypothetical protein